MTSEQIKEKKYKINDVLKKIPGEIEISDIETNEGKKYILKKFILSRYTKEEIEKYLVIHRQEFTLLTKNYPNVAKAHKDYYDDVEKAYYFTMDRYEYDLEKYTSNKGKLEFAETFEIFKDVVTGLYHLFRRDKTNHRDIKPENLFIDKVGRGYVGDVGESKGHETTYKALIGNKSSTIVGTPQWMAPEIHSDHIKNKDSTTLKNVGSADTFSLGLVFLYVLDPENYKKIKDLNSNENNLKLLLTKFQTVNLTSNSSPDYIKFYELLSEMVQYDPYRRPSIIKLNSYIQMDGFRKKQSEAQKANLLKREKVLEAFESMKDLNSTSLSLDLFPDDETNQIDDEAIFLISIQLAEMKRLKSLDLSPNQTLMTDEGLKYISHALTLLPNLEILDLHIGINNISDVGLMSLFEAFTEIKGLKELLLQIDELKITNEGIRYLAMSLERLQMVEKLSILAHKNPSLSNESLKSIGTVIENMKSLSSLYLNLSSTNITDDGLLTFANLIGKNKDIKDLHLKFNNTKILDHGLEGLSNSCKALPVLKKFWLDIGMTEITDNSLVNLGKDFESKPTLTDFALWTGKSKITEKGKNDFKSRIKKKDCSVKIS